jgi:coatomer subunit beta'
LEIRKAFQQSSDRVKSIDYHPTDSEPWILLGLYTAAGGHAHIWNYETDTLLKQFEVSEFPIRAARFVARKKAVDCRCWGCMTSAFACAITT